MHGNSENKENDRRSLWLNVQVRKQRQTAWIGITLYCCSLSAFEFALSSADFEV